MKKFLSIFLSTCILLSTASPVAYATENEQNFEITADTSIYETLPSDDELFNGYVDQVFYGGISTFGTAARDYLNSVEQQIYDKLKAVIVDVAANGGSTEITINPADIAGLTYLWPSGTDVMAEFEKQASVYNIWHALIHDCPYDLYWLDKNQNNMSMGMTTTDDGTNVTINKLNFIFFVSLNYQPAFNQKTTVKSDVAVVKTAVRNAQKIVDKYADLDDYSKLVAYRDEICSLVKFDSNAIEGGIDYVDNSSWQMINVLDGLAATNAVSDGYTKAFQYLCDLSEFDSAECYTIKGTIDYVDFMWNIVTMEDGKTYLLDVTNSDEGRPGEYGQFFLAGYDDGGRWSGFVVNGQNYAYHSSTLFDIDMLILADKDYFYVPQGTAHYGQCGDNVYWLLSEDGTLTITGWGDMWSDYYTSNTASHLPPWHEYVKDIKAIVVEEGITSICDYRFYLCQYATTATIPDTVTSIGEMAFYSCMALKELSVPDSVTNLETAAFGNCTSLEKINLPQNITQIPAWLLNNAAITEIKIPDGITSIGEYAFYGCNNLTVITLPASVATVGDEAFNTYPDNVIEEVFFKGSEERWDNISFGQYNDFSQAYIHFNYDPAAIFTITSGSCENGRISVDKATAQYGETVTVTATPDDGYKLIRIFVNNAEIEGNTFVVRSDSMVTAEFLKTADSIIAYGTCGNDAAWTLTADYTLTISGTGDMANYSTALDVPWCDYAAGIKKVVIERGIASIGDYAFYGCISLAEIDIPDSVQSISDYAFRGCISLKEVSIPDGVTSIGMSTFENCTSLEKVVIPDSVEVIAHKAFNGCTSLKNIEFPAHSMAIHSYAFANCTALENIHIYRDTENSSFVDEYAFYNCKKLKTATLEGVRYIGPYSFSGCVSLEEAVMNNNGIPDTYVKITKISESAFNGCSNLKKIYIPSTVTMVEEKAFNRCSSLTDVYFEGTKSQWSDVAIENYNDSILTANIHCKEVTESVAMYRMYNPYSGEHFYTGSVKERDNLISVGWNYEGIGFYAPVEGVAIHRLYNPNAGDHHYTSSVEERDHLISVGWNYEGIGWYSAQASDDGAIPLQRLYNPNAVSGSHHYTASITERDNLVRLGWIHEGIGWYGVEKPQQ